MSAGGTFFSAAPPLWSNHNYCVQPHDLLNQHHFFHLVSESFLIKYDWLSKQIKNVVQL